MPRRLLFKKLVLPPSGPLLLGLAGLALALAGADRAGLALIFASLASLYLLSAPWFVAGSGQGVQATGVQASGLRHSVTRSRPARSRCVRTLS